MTSTRRVPAQPTRLLLDSIRDPSACVSLDDHQWDQLVRTARASRLLGILAHRIERLGLASQLPTAVASHLRAALAESTYLRQMTLRQLAAVETTLRPTKARLLALKGAAYILRNAECAAGRMPRDVDIMVERSRLDDVERALMAAGWSFEESDAYDQHYYRAWSHELPPMRAPAMPFELDVHHTIAPPLGRLRPDAYAMFEAAVPAAGTAWWTLCPVDLVLHLATHLYQDSEWSGRLRDLVDFDSLVREAADSDPTFWRVLPGRARRHGLGGPLWYMLTLSKSWMSTPIGLAPDDLASLAPAVPGRHLVLALSRRCLDVVDPDAEPSWRDRLAYSSMSLRAAWMRMPPHLFVYHASRKFIRSLRRDPDDERAA